MMTYEIFKETVNKRFNDFLPEDIRGEVVIRKITKNNQILDGLSVKREGVVPQIYINYYYQEMIESECSVEDIISKMSSIYTDGVRNIPFTVEQAIESITLDKVVGKLVNANRNKEMLTKCPHRIIVGDIALVYRIRYSTKMSAMVTYDIMKEQLKCSEEDLYKQAKINASTVEAKSLEQTMLELLPDEIKEDYRQLIAECPPQEDIIVLRTENINGAVAMINTVVLEEIRESFGSKTVRILPSSVHEVLVANEKMPIEELKDMVVDVNSNELAEEDFLSDNVFIWDGEKYSVA